MNKSRVAKVLGYGSVVITYVNQILQANGGLLPSTKAGWLQLAGSILLAGGIHHASNTGGNNPAGQK